MADRSLIQLQPDIISSRITQLLQTESAQRALVNLQTESTQRVPINLPIPSTAIQVQDTSFSLRTERTAKSCKSKRIQAARLRWKSYCFLIGQAWDMEIRRSQKGWDFSMSVYACVPHDSLVAEYAMNGNIEGLQRLFSLGKASPSTVCISKPAFIGRRTLLDVCVILPVPLLLSLIRIDWSRQRGLKAL